MRARAPGGYNPAMAEPRYLLDLPPEAAETALAELAAEAGEPAYRARQVLEWVYRKRVDAFAAMHTLPAPFRGFLAGRVTLRRLAVGTRQASRDGSTKTLWVLPDGERVESMRMPHPGRLTLCLSSQVGCPLQCAFCATGLLGLRRDLSPGEIVEQVLWTLAEEPAVPSCNLVFMGMGEPLLNLDAVLAAIALLTHPDRGGIGKRRITVSTVGLPEQIVALGRAEPGVRLALSLHAPDDARRRELMPIARKHTLTEVLEACRAWIAATHQRVTFEYLLLPGVNDAPADARALAALLNPLPGKVNLIPYNPVPGLPFVAPDPKRVDAFGAALAAAAHFPVTVRWSKGRDIAGACGQLRAETA